MAVSLALTITACGSSVKSGSGSAPGSPAQASAYVYWANNNTIGRANLNGTGANQRFITGARRTRMVAVTARYIYWSSDNGTIGRANLNGTGVRPRFITGASGPVGVAVTSKYVYWANNSTGTIGRANLNGTGVHQRFITGPSGPSGLAVDSGHIYWANEYTSTIGRADLDGTGAEVVALGVRNSVGFDWNPENKQLYFTDALAIDSDHIYWANFGSGTIGRADLEGTSASQSFITAHGHPGGVAVAPGP